MLEIFLIFFNMVFFVVAVVVVVVVVVIVLFSPYFVNPTILEQSKTTIIRRL